MTHDNSLKYVAKDDIRTYEAIKVSAPDDAGFDLGLQVIADNFAGPEPSWNVKATEADQKGRVVAWDVEVFTTEADGRDLLHLFRIVAE